MIVTTIHGQYRVEEEAPGEFRITLLEGHDNLPANLVGGQPGVSLVRHGPIRLRVGGGWCYSAAGVQLVDCGCNRIVSIAP
jgi:hypothetical protein